MNDKFALRAVVDNLYVSAGLDIGRADRESLRGAPVESFTFIRL
jgi:hypothetical protein